MNNTLVSVIIPAFNSEKYIDEAIQSVLQQSYHELEVLIIDDGSTDNQKEIIQGYCLIDPRVRYFYQNNQGVSAARNYGFQISKGQFIAFLDADDVWLPENIFLKMQKFENGNYGLVHSDGLRIYEKSNQIVGKIEGNEGWLLEEMLAWNGTQIPGPSSILIKREVIDQVGLFDPALSTSADQDFFLRVAAEYEIGRVVKPTWKYRVHGSNMHKNIPQMEKDVLYVYKKASDNNFFKNRSFEKKCYSNMYLILAATWAGNGKNLTRFFYFLIKAFVNHPPSIFKYLSRHFKKWLHL